MTDFPGAPTPPPPSGPRRLVRRRDDRMIAGVCSGLAAYAGVDPTVVRVLTVVLGLIFIPVVPLGYLVLWLVMPQE